MRSVRVAYTLHILLCILPIVKGFLHIYHTCTCIYIGQCPVASRKYKFHISQHGIRALGIFSTTRRFRFGLSLLFSRLILVSSVVAVQIPSQGFPMQIFAFSVARIPQALFEINIKTEIAAIEASSPCVSIPCCSTSQEVPTWLLQTCSDSIASAAARVSVPLATILFLSDSLASLFLLPLKFTPFGFYDIFVGPSLSVFSFHAPTHYNFGHIQMLLGPVILWIVGRFLLTLFFLVIISLPGRRRNVLQFPIRV